MTKPQTLSLRDYTDEMLALDDLVDMEDGEWLPEHEALFAEHATAMAVKVDDLWEFRVSLKARIAGARTYAAEIAAKAKRLEARLEKLDTYTMQELDRQQRQKLPGNFWTIRKQKNSSPSTIVDVLADALPPEFVRVVPEVREPDRDAIKAAILAGATVEGCHLEYGFHLRAS